MLFIWILCVLAGEYRPDLNISIVKNAVDRATVGKSDTFGSTVPRCVCMCVSTRKHAHWGKGGRAGGYGQVRHFWVRSSKGSAVVVWSLVLIYPICKCLKCQEKIVDERGRLVEPGWTKREEQVARSLPGPGNYDAKVDMPKPIKKTADAAGGLGMVHACTHGKTWWPFLLLCSNLTLQGDLRSRA
eukprot:1145029-Pelagomonas_calceolata.AAC.7